MCLWTGAVHAADELTWTYIIGGSVERKSTISCGGEGESAPCCEGLQKCVTDGVCRSDCCAHIIPTAGCADIEDADGCPTQIKLDCGEDGICVNNACQSCPNNFVPNADKTACVCGITSCPTGQYKTDDCACRDCPDTKSTFACPEEDGVDALGCPTYREKTCGDGERLIKSCTCITCPAFDDSLTENVCRTKQIDENGCPYWKEEGTVCGDKCCSNGDTCLDRKKGICCAAFDENARPAVCKRIDENGCPYWDASCVPCEEREGRVSACSGSYDCAPGIFTDSDFVSSCTIKNVSITPKKISYDMHCGRGDWGNVAVIPGGGAARTSRECHPQDTLYGIDSNGHPYPINSDYSGYRIDATSVLQASNHHGGYSTCHILFSKSLGTKYPWCPNGGSCVDGYCVKCPGNTFLSKKECKSCPLPAHAHYENKTGCGWACDNGYEKKNKCLLKTKKWVESGGIGWYATVCKEYSTTESVCKGCARWQNQLVSIGGGMKKWEKVCVEWDV